MGSPSYLGEDGGDSRPRGVPGGPGLRSCGRTSRVALLVIAAASGCGEAAREAAPLAEVAPLVLTEELRVGSLDDPDRGFTSSGSIHVEPSGEMFVLETEDQQVRLYDAEGRHLRNYGRRGEGPREFRSIYDFGVKGDTLWVSDGSHRRLTLFHRSGALLGTIFGTVEVPLSSDGAFEARRRLEPIRARRGSRSGFR